VTWISAKRPRNTTTRLLRNLRKCIVLSLHGEREILHAAAEGCLWLGGSLTQPRLAGQEDRGVPWSLSADVRQRTSNKALRSTPRREAVVFITMDGLRPCPSMVAGDDGRTKRGGASVVPWGGR